MTTHRERQKAAEHLGGRIEFDGLRGPVPAKIIAVWRDGVTLRRDDTGTIQFLHRGDYRVLAD